MNDSNTDDDGNNHHNNWLGFSLSPHMKMEVTSSASPHHHSHQDHHHHYYHSAASSSTVPSDFYLSHSGICYGVGENSPFHYSPLAMMPLKSDGSLCIMEALTRSQTQGWTFFSSPIFVFSSQTFQCIQKFSS